MTDIKPWDIQKNSGKKIEDSFFIPLWAPYKANDFYFATRCVEEEGKTIVVIYIVPGEYWDKNGRSFYDSMPIMRLLPNYFEETSEGVYEADQNISHTKVRDDLLKKGFIHNHYFQTYIDKNQFSIHM